MRRGVIIIIIGVLLIAVSAVAYIWWQQQQAPGSDDGTSERADGAPATETPVPTPTEVLTLPILVAVQEIPRGAVVSRDANGNFPIAYREWPVDALPPGAIIGGTKDEIDPHYLQAGAVIGGSLQDKNGNGVEDLIDFAVGKQLRTSTVLYEPILADMLSDQGRIDVAGIGSDVALTAPNGRVVIALPLPRFEEDPTAAVAYALRPGDHIDMIVSLALVDLDEEFHTQLPNTTQLLDLEVLSDTEGEGIELIEFTQGRIEQGPLGLTFNIIPGEDQQRVRAVTQLTVQDAIVMRVGRYPTLEEEMIGLDPQASPTPTTVPPTLTAEEAAATATPVPAAGAQQQAPEPTPEPTPEPEMPQVIVLAVEPQDALVIHFAWKINADVTYALRAVGDEAVRHFLEPVTLQYLMEQYNIAVPPKLQYGIEPPIGRIDDLITDVTQ
jgi:Flp pilus assembly protein CpaB